MFHLPLDIIHFILEFLSYQELILIEKAFPQKEEFFHTTKLKKGRIISSNLNDEIDKMRKKCRKEESELEYILKITRCYLLLQPCVLMMYRYLKEFMKLKRRKSQLEAELCIEHHANI